jgi:hypothetical protein
VTQPKDLSNTPICVITTSGQFQSLDGLQALPRVRSERNVRTKPWPAIVVVDTTCQHCTKASSLRPQSPCTPLFGAMQIEFRTEPKRV